MWMDNEFLYFLRVHMLCGYRALSGTFHCVVPESVEDVRISLLEKKK